MDDNVAAALARWPDVPAVYGWLSLSETGHWRLHPEGKGWGVNSGTEPFNPEPGESIQNEQVLNFINRNYARDNKGRWFFQNGPQRVYVRLDAAPFILHFHTPSLALHTHNGLTVTQIQAWWIDERGRLFASTEHGPGMVAGRDAMAVFEALRTLTGTPLIEKLEEAIMEDATINLSGLRADAEFARMEVQLQLPGNDTTAGPDVAAVHFCASHDLGARLGFIPLPAP